jgi:hypothetical protein
MGQRPRPTPPPEETGDCSGSGLPYAAWCQACVDRDAVAFVNRRRKSEPRRAINVNFCPTVPYGRR